MDERDKSREYGKFINKAKGLSCSIDSNARNPHDTTRFENYDDFEEFCAYYRKETGLTVKSKSPRVGALRISVNETVCSSCPYSDSSSSLPCPMKEEFTSGTCIEMDTPKYRDIVCKNSKCRFCGKQQNLSAYSSNTRRMHDVLYKSRPTVIKINRYVFRCTCEEKDAPVLNIPGVEVDGGGHLTRRLLIAINKTWLRKREKGYSVLTCKRIAEGYGLGRKTLSSYLQKEQQELTDMMLQKLAVKIEQVIEAEIADRYYWHPKMEKATHLYNRYMAVPIDIGMQRKSFMFFCEAPSASPNTNLQMMFDADTVKTARNWMRGKFAPGDDIELSGARLTVFAYYFSATNFIRLAHPFGFMLARMVLLYGQVLARNYDLRHLPLTDSLCSILKKKTHIYVLSDLHDICEGILALDALAAEDDLLKAAEALRHYIDLFSFQLPEKRSRFYSGRKAISDSSGIKLLCDALAAELASLPDIPVGEDYPMEYYQGNPDLILYRLLLFNEAAARNALNGRPLDELYDENGQIRRDIDFSGGVPVSELLSLVQDGGLFQ